MKLIFHLIILAALTSYYSISAIKCYDCTDGPHTGPNEVQNDFCSNQANSDSWKIVDCAGRCVWKFRAYSTIGLRKIDYRTGAIVTRGLYIYYPIFGDHFFVFKKIISLFMVSIQEQFVI